MHNSYVLAANNQISPTIQIPWHFPDLSLTLGLFPDYSLTSAEFPDISRFPEIPESGNPAFR